MKELKKEIKDLSESLEILVDLYTRDQIKNSEIIKALEDRIRDMELWTGFKCGDCDGRNLKNDEYGHRWCDDCEPGKYHIPEPPSDPFADDEKP